MKWFSSTLLVAAIFPFLLACVPTRLWENLFVLGQGRSSSQLATAFTHLLFSLSILLCGLSALFHFFGSTADSSLRRLALHIQPTDAHERRLWFFAALLLVGLFDGRSLLGGYFASDDYDLLLMDHREPLSALISKTHNDHVIALLRIEFRLITTLFGVNAIAFNALALASFTLLLSSGCWLLRDSGGSRLATLVFLLSAVAWTSWGAFTSGQYILLKYMQISIAGALCLWFLRRWFLDGRRSWLAGVVVCTSFACWMNVSGFWVPLAFITFLTCDSIGQNRNIFNSHKRLSILPLLVAIAAGVVSAIAFDVYAYQLPGNQALLAHTDNTSRHFVIMASQFCSLISAVIMSDIFAFTHHLAKFGLLKIASGLTLFTSGCLTIWAVRKSERTKAARLIAFVLIMFGISAMTCLGRPMQEFDLIWPAKYLGPVFFWFCLALGLSSDVIVSDAKHLLTRRLVIVFLSLIVFCQYSCDTLCSSGIPFFEVDVSRSSLLVDRSKERHAVLQLKKTLIEPLTPTEKPLFLPDVPGTVLCKYYPELTYTWGQQPSLVMFEAILFDDLHPDSRITAVESEQISPIFFKLYHQNPLLQELYQQQY